ncbi:SdpI family protein [Actinomyces sp.]
MRNDKLPPNMWAGIRTKVASESESSWYQVQRAGAVPLMCLAIAYTDSGFLFILQGIYHETLSVLIPVIVFSVQSLVGIIWIYRASNNSAPSQNQSRTSEFSERIKAT